MLILLQEGTSTERPNDLPTSSNEHHVNENATSDDNENVNSVFRKRSRGVGKRKNYKEIVVDKLTHIKKRKLVICIPPGDHFRHVGEYERQLAGYIGYNVRSTVDIPKYPWAYVETTYFTTMLGMVLDYFEISKESPEWWKLKEANGEVEPDVVGVKMEKFIVHCKERMQKAYGRWKYDLHDHYIKCKKDDVRMKNILEGLSLEGWMAMMEIFADEKYKAKCKKNGENREEIRIFSRTGPTSFLQIEYRMMNRETGELPQTSDLWMKQHAYVIEGEEPHWFSQDAKKIYEEIKAMEALQGDGDELPLTSEDILADVLGTKSGRIWGKGSGFRTKKKVNVSVSQSEEVKRLKDQLEKQAKEMEKEIEKQVVERENQNKEIETLKEKLKGMDALNNEVQQMKQFFQNFSKNAFNTQLTIDPQSN